MKRKIGTAVALLLALVTLTATTGCRWVKFPTFTESKTFSIQTVPNVRADIEQGVGELTVRPAAGMDAPLQADFTFAPESWRPVTSSSTEASTAVVRIVQPSDAGFNIFGYTRNVWNISLPIGHRTDLTVRLGAGNANVDLRGVDLTALDAEIGAGDLTLDLSGGRLYDLTARIRFGAGNVTVRVSRRVGIRVVLQEKGVGNMTFDGLRSQGDVYVNDAYAGSGPKIDVLISRGAGNITFELVD
jgi:hypothetical protein